MPRRREAPSPFTAPGVRSDLFARDAGPFALARLRERNPGRYPGPGAPVGRIPQDGLADSAGYRGEVSVYKAPRVERRHADASPRVPAA